MSGIGIDTVHTAAPPTDGVEHRALWKALERFAGTLVDRYKLGALISNFTMQNVQPQEQVQSAFDDAVKAGQDRARARNEGEAYANDLIPRARGAARARGGRDRARPVAGSCFGGGDV